MNRKFGSATSHAGVVTCLLIGVATAEAQIAPPPPPQIATVAARLEPEKTRGFGVVFLTNGHQAHPHLVRLTTLALDLLAEELGQGR